MIGELWHNGLEILSFGNFESHEIHKKGFLYTKIDFESNTTEIGNNFSKMSNI